MTASPSPDSQPKPPPRILTIAGSDSSGGAGIQADIKTITMLGGYAMSAITATTAQNSQGVSAIVPLSAEFVHQQIIACLTDIGVDAIKIGMLHDLDIIEAVDDALDQVHSNVPLVLDPVMVATSGAILIAQPAIEAMRDKLFSRASLITPNLPELEHLLARNLRNSALMEEGANELLRAHGCAVLAKGGHTDGEAIIDILATSQNGARHFSDARINSVHTHGTGCTLSAAIATLLGHGQPLDNAVHLARQFVREAISKAPGFGRGNGPLGHQAVRKA